MPVDLTVEGRFNSLTAEVRKVTSERDALRAQLADHEGLYDEIEARQQEVERLQRVEGEYARTAQQCEQMRAALEDIARRKGRGAVKIAEAALKSG